MLMMMMMMMMIKENKYSNSLVASVMFYKETVEHDTTFHKIPYIKLQCSHYQLLCEFHA